MADNLEDQFSLKPEFESRKRKNNDSAKGGSKKKKKKEDVKVYGVNTLEKPLEKKFDKKRRKKKKVAGPKKELDQTSTPLSPSSLTKAVSTHYKGVLSPLEMEKIQLDATHFSVCNDQTHTTTSLINTLMPRVKKTLASNGGVVGRPVVVVLCASGVRCVAFIRQLQEFKSDKCTIAKLFAKHLKLEQTQDFLRKKVIHMAVGTPHRISQLLDNGDISLKSTQHIILDLSHRDDKKMNMLQIKIVKENLMELLTKHLIPHVKKSNNNNNNNNGDAVISNLKSKTKDASKGGDVGEFPCKICLY